MKNERKTINKRIKNVCKKNNEHWKRRNKGKRKINSKERHKKMI